MEVQWCDYQEDFIKWADTTCKENRIGLIKMLLSNLTVDGVKDIQNISARIVKRKLFSTSPTTEKLEDKEEAWWEVPNAERLTNWAGYTAQNVLIAYIKKLLRMFRQTEVQSVRSSWTYHAREAILHPERPVSRQQSVSGRVGWWTPYMEPEGRILAVDCEMVSKIIGKKPNGRNRCKNIAGTVSVYSNEGKIVYKATVKYSPEEIHLTYEMKRITGFHKRYFVNGTELCQIQKELRDLFRGKLLILVSAGSDFSALGLNKGDFDVFDLHQHYTNDVGCIALRKLVWHYFNIDIQKGIHDPDRDAKYTMKMFLEIYIPDKLSHPDELESRFTERKFNNIKDVE